MGQISPIEHVRAKVFGVTQAEFARIAGASQATVSRWEQGLYLPDGACMKRIREEAISRGIPWDDALFFEQPAGGAVTEGV